MSQKIADLLDLNVTNIIVGRAHAMLSFTHLYQAEKDKKEIENEFLILPLSTYHHSNYNYHFKGACAEYLNPIIHTQNKEFLDICINTPADILGVVSYDFNIIQISADAETDEIKVVKKFTKAEAQEILKQNPDYRFTDF